MSALTMMAPTTSHPSLSAPRTAEPYRPRKSADRASVQSFADPYRAAVQPVFIDTTRTVKGRPVVAMAEQAFFAVMFSGAVALAGSFAIQFFG